MMILDSGLLFGATMYRIKQLWRSNTVIRIQ